MINNIKSLPSSVELMHSFELPELGWENSVHNFFQPKASVPTNRNTLFWEVLKVKGWACLVGRTENRCTLWDRRLRRGGGTMPIYRLKRQLKPSAKETQQHTELIRLSKSTHRACIHEESSISAQLLHWELKNGGLRYGPVIDVESSLKEAEKGFQMQVTHTHNIHILSYVHVYCMCSSLGAWACMSVRVHNFTVGVGCLLLYQGSLLLNLELTNSR